MGLESVDFIDDLVITNPVSATDLVRYGASHLRNLKNGIRNSFAGTAGAILCAGVDVGTVNAIVLTPTPALIEYTTRMLIVWHQSITNTSTTPTINISGLGAKTIVSVSGGALAAGDLVANRVYVGVYDGTAGNVQLVAVTKNFVEQLAFNTVLPAQPGGTPAYYLDSTGGVASWKLFVPDQIIRSPRTANTIIGVADRGTLIDITSGNFTQTFSTAVTLGSGWYCYYGNSGTGDITLNPDGAETIDGLASYIMYPGELRLVQCDGTAFRTKVLNSFNRAFIATGPFTTPPGYQYFEGEIWNGGNSGGKSSAGNAASGGGGGGCFPFFLPSVLFGTTETMTIGAGGTAIAAASTSGNVGGVSSIGSILSLVAASNYIYGSGVTNIAASGAIALGFEPSSNAGGTSAIYGGGSTNIGNVGGSSLYGGGAGGGVFVSGSSSVVAAGTSKVGGNGGAASLAGAGTDGVAPGGGGGATQTGATSGAGARGEIRIRGRI
jgi:hypothetical protein